MQKTKQQKNFSKRGVSALSVGNVLQFQNDSYETFLKKDLVGLFHEFFPITDSNERFSINFIDAKFKDPQISPAEAKEKIISYTIPFLVTLQLENKITGTKREEEVLFGDIPMMTPQHTFIINGVERTVISQLIRTQGVSFFQ